MNCIWLTYAYMTYTVNVCRFLGLLVYISSPVIVVKVLTYECVWLDGPVNVHLRHVEVIYKVDEPLSSRRGEFSTSFLLQGFL